MFRTSFYVLPKQLERNDEIWYNIIQQFKSFSKKHDLLSELNNIFCISDEVHRTQLSIESKLIKTDKGIETTYGYVALEFSQRNILRLYELCRSMNLLLY